MPDALTTQERIQVLGEAIDAYEGTIDKQIHALTPKFVMEIFTVIVIPVAATVVTYFFSNLAVAIAPLSVGGVNAVSKLTESTNILKSYFKDRSGLDTRVNYLRVNLRLAEQESDQAKQKSMLDKIKLQLEEWTKT